MTAVPDHIEWLNEQCSNILQAAMNREFDRTARLIAETGERYGDHGVYTLCCGLAEVVAVLGKFVRGGLHGFEVHQAGVGPIAPEEVSEDAVGGVAAFRFVTAHLNEDDAQKWALFLASPVATAGGLGALAGMYGRHRAAEHKAEVARKAKRPKRRKRRRP